MKCWVVEHLRFYIVLSFLNMMDHIFVDFPFCPIVSSKEFVRFCLLHTFFAININCNLFEHVQLRIFAILVHDHSTDIFIAGLFPNPLKYIILYPKCKHAHTPNSIFLWYFALIHMCVLFGEYSYINVVSRFF